jgi:hypothetical protein
MPAAEIQGDAAFIAFQSKLATVAVNAAAIGKRIKPGCCCPLGAHPEALSTHPPSHIAQQGGWPEVSKEHLVQFINGWHGLLNHGTDTGFSGPYAELGALYRETFR